jgi:protein involved in polysaccharide export with SLBB domain
MATQKINITGITALILGLSTVIFAYSPQPGDTLDIQILNKKELNTRQLVAPDGTISLPFI